MPDTGRKSSRSTSSDLLERMKGGHLWTVLVNQRFGSRLGSSLGDRGFTPNQLSLLNLAVGLTTSVACLALAAWSLPVAGAVAFVGWQVAYTFDCADGQLARATGQSSPEGFLIDLICDYLVQASVVVTLVFHAAPALPDDRAGAVLAGGIVATFLIGVFASALGGSTGLNHRVATSLWKELIRSLFRDWGIQVACYAVALGIGAWPVLVVVTLFSGVNLVFLALRLARFALYGMPTD